MMSLALWDISLQEQQDHICIGCSRSDASSVMGVEASSVAP